MLVNQFSLDLNKELIVDNFAGGGGASTGIFSATGRHVDHAINHDKFALGMHRINHPQTVHHCEDVFDVVPRVVCDGRPVALGWFSPDCKHFSKAKGGRPLSKKIRGLILVMLRWAKYGVRVMYMENVEEIKTWGPLLPDGYPDKANTGRTWRAFLDAMTVGCAADHPDLDYMVEVLEGTVTREEIIQGFGCDLEYKELRACDYGAPTIRKRLYLIARKDGMPIVWPKPTHAPREKAKALKLKPYRAIAECIDWSLPCHSIFLTRDEARKFRCKRPLATSTLRRVAVGTDRYVLKANNPFLVNLTHQGGDRVEPITEPGRTTTAAHRGEKALCNVETAPFLTEHANASAQRTFPADEPMRTQCGEVKGGHFAMASAGLVRTAHGDIDKNGKKRGRGAHSIEESSPSVLASSDCGLFTAHMAVQTTDHPGGAADEPGKTIATGGHQTLVTGHLARFNGDHEGRQDGAQRGQEPELPLGTLDTSNRFAVVSGSVVGCGWRAAQSPPRPMDTPMATGTAKADACLTGVSLVQTGYGEREGQAPRTIDPNKPGTTSVAGGCKEALAAASMVKLRGTNIGHGADEPGHTVSSGGQHQVASVAYLAQHNDGFNTNPGHPATDPASTINATGSQQGVVAGSMVKYYGTDQDPRIDEGCHSVTTKDRFGLNQHEAWCPPLTEEQLAGARRVAAFLREYDVEFEGEFATITVEGIVYVIVDIGMRMLTPRELFRAQGFPDEYVIDKAWMIDPQTGEIIEVTLTKEQQIRMCGNSVCPPVAKALIRANQPELCSPPPRKRATRRLEKVFA